MLLYGAQANTSRESSSYLRKAARYSDFYIQAYIHDTLWGLLFPESSCWGSSYMKVVLLSCGGGAKTLRKWYACNAIQQVVLWGVRMAYSSETAA